VLWNYQEFTVYQDTVIIGRKPSTHCDSLTENETYNMLGAAFLSAVFYYVTTGDSSMFAVPIGLLAVFMWANHERKE
jgi:hypothetical protein